MQVIFFEQWQAILICFILWGVIQSSIGKLIMKVPDNFLSPYSFLFRTHKWEKGGKIYNKFFRVKKWKHLLPDGAAVVKGGYKKKHLTDFSKKNLEIFLIESCRAELSHYIAILPFWVFGFFVPPIVVLYMLIYALAVNLPCIFVQRYNRPRIIKLIDKMK